MLNSVTFGQIVASNCFARSSRVVDGILLLSIVEFPSDKGVLRSDGYTGWLKVAAVMGLTSTRKPLVYLRVGSHDSLSSQNEHSGAESRRLALKQLVAMSQHCSVRLRRRERALVARFAAEESQ
jgi:hypothetical protein